MKKQYWLIVLFLAPLWLVAQQRIIVDATGKGNYTTIQEAVNSLPDSSATDRIIFIKNGIYKEQVNIAKAHVVLQGESKEKTIITSAVASLIYSCEHPHDNNDAILNLDGNDITPYNLGRYHHEANFYLINCRFDNKLIDTPIYKAATAKPMAWESTAYYYGCHKEGKQFAWFKDNLSTAPGSPAAAAINAKWTFDGKWPLSF